MISLSGKVNFNADEFEKKAMKAAADAIVKRLSRARCPVHGKTATIKPVPSRKAGDIEFDITGCCDELVNSVKGQLK